MNDAKKRFFTSESVTMGHPDKVADQISDGILDACLDQDPRSRVACETMVKTGLVVIAGEVTTDAKVDYEAVARDVIREIGYTDSQIGFDADSCGVLVGIGQQSPDISRGVTAGEGLHDEQGAGDQGMMFGFACNETPTLMPLPIHLAHRLVEKLAELRRSGGLPWLRPDGKSQVTVEYQDLRPVRVDTAVISTQHTDEVTHEQIREAIIEQCIKAIIPAELLDDRTIYHVNPTGRFVVGGPHGDCGLTGRKIIVDTYGGRGRHGGGAFSGKDPSKVDRSAAYMARHVAKCVVAARLAEQCEVQLSYAIGVAAPTSVYVDTKGTSELPESVLSDAIRKVFPLTPQDIIEYLDLLRPIYRETARHGHFGRDLPDFTWENTEQATLLKKEAAQEA